MYPIWAVIKGRNRLNLPHLKMQSVSLLFTITLIATEAMGVLAYLPIKAPSNHLNTSPLIPAQLATFAVVCIDHNPNSNLEFATVPLLQFQRRAFETAPSTA